MGWTIQPRWQKGQQQPIVQQYLFPQIWGRIKKEKK